VTDQPAPDHPERPSRRRIWLRRVVVLVVVAALFGAGAYGFSGAMQSARADAADAHTAALALRVERIRLGTIVAATEADLERTWNERTLRHAQRVQINARLQALYTRLLGVNKQLADLIASSKLHVLNLDATKQCLLGVQRATEQVAVDDAIGSFASLQRVEDACNRANAVGRSA
jgi:hypothetical protein